MEMVILPGKHNVYNQATFIGSVHICFIRSTGEKRYLDNAILAADYIVKDMSAEHKVLPFEGGIEQGIYTAIFAEYMAWLVYDCGQTQYLPFLKRTIKQVATEIRHGTYVEANTIKSCRKVRKSTVILLPVYRH